MKNVFDASLGVIKTTHLGQVYPVVNNYILNKMNWEESRDGRVKEMLDIKTVITNPYRRCVGGYRRNVNVFFLLAEAMWIVLGRKDVETLANFNSNMKKFSDDGEVFHAPYGFRIRHWGVRSEDSYNRGVDIAQGSDQVMNAIKLFTENANTRQVVMSIWNPDLDLGFKTRDIPCNDMVMLKIRNGKLITTIQNRSNDLHWGLPTNVFQFSFLTEVMAACLGVGLGTQTHNSQSLHLYEWNDIANTLDDEYKRLGDGFDLYRWAHEIPMDFEFSHEVPANRFREIEYFFSVVIDNLNRIARGEGEVVEEVAVLHVFSSYLHNVYDLLKIYLLYRRDVKAAEGDEARDVVRLKAIADIEQLELTHGLQGWDVSMLAKNFFAARLCNKIDLEHIGKL